MRHVGETRQKRSAYVGERLRSPVGVVEFQTMINHNKEWYLNCKKCAFKSDPGICAFVECFLAYQEKTDLEEEWVFGYYVKIEEKEK